MATKKKTSTTPKTKPLPTDEEAKAPETPIKVITADVDTSQLITVINGFQGKLIYISPRTGERFVWDSFGDEQEIELRELRNAKSSAKGFFTNNWFMFGEEFAWVIDYLGLRQYYKHAIGIEDFDNIFSKSPKDIEAIVGEMSEGQKQSLGFRARELVAEGMVDSLRVIEAIEKALGVELIER